LTYTYIDGIDLNKNETGIEKESKNYIEEYERNVSHNIDNGRRTI
jgi:hypothetical protein